MSILFCWGSGQDGQLGLGAMDKDIVSTPTEMASFHGALVQDISCGKNHSIFVLKDSRTYTCGNNDHGHLGHDKSRTRPGQVDALKALHVKQVSAGDSYSMVLHEGGEIYSWGNNTWGELGRGHVEEELCRVPKLVKGLATHTVIQVSCGNHHCMALTNEGHVWCWGANNHGQLGIGSSCHHKEQPQLLQCLQGIPVRQIAAGGSHTFILSVSGALFGWGKNCFGQLGINDEKDRHYPTLCKSLRNQKIKYVTCGEDHTAVLTHDGGVFTFGAGSYGQLGHDVAHNEIMPRMVMDLMGSVVTQIACGRRHTIAHVPTSGRIYAFGLGGCGQLGQGTNCNRSSPFPIKGSFVPATKSEQMQVDDPSYVVNKIYAGGDYCFVIATHSQECEMPEDFRECKSALQILSVTPDLIEQICNLPADEKVSPELEEILEKVFRSSSCLNASYLKPNDGHYGCSSKNHGVNIDLVRADLSKLYQMKSVSLSRLLCNHLESTLPRLPSSPPDVEALRLYLILPETPFFEKPHHYRSLIAPFGASILKMDRPASRILELWWATFKSMYFSRIVYVYKQCVVYILQLSETNLDPEVDNRNRCLFISLQLLKKLNTVNEQNGQIIPYHQFYISELKDKVDIRQDYYSWIHQKDLSPPGQISVSFCDYPFLFDAAAKTILLQTDALLQMQTAINEVNWLSLNYFLPVNTINSCLILFIHRNNLVQDTLDQLAKYHSTDLKKPLKVYFVNEDAVDAGGVRKEFFMLILREILDPKYGMFKYYEESRLQWFNSETFEGNDKFHLIGIICGLAIYNFTIVVLPFPLALYKKLLRRPVTLDDLTQLMPSVGRSLNHLLEYEENDFEETFDLTFEITREYFGEVRKVELVPDGSTKIVTKENRMEFVNAYIDYIFTSSVKDQFEAFCTGFLKVCGGRILELFHPQELQAMVIGNDNYDFHELEKNTEYKGDYHRYQTTIKFFWEVFHELSQEEKKKFLLFLTGSDRIPVAGMGAVKLIIQPTGGGEDFLPVAHTCFNILDLPKYSSKSKLKEKLLRAIDHAEGFGLV